MSKTDNNSMREKFWKEMAEEVGEEILEHALLRVITSEPEDLKDKWILFFSSASSLYYKRFPHDSMMARLFNMGPKEEDYPVENCKWEDLVCRREKPQGFLSRLMGTPSVLELKWGSDARFLLEMDRKGEALFKGRLEQK